MPEENFMPEEKNEQLPPEPETLVTGPTIVDPDAPVVPTVESRLEALEGRVVKIEEWLDTPGEPLPVPEIPAELIKRIEAIEANIQLLLKHSKVPQVRG